MKFMGFEIRRKRKFPPELSPRPAEVQYHRDEYHVFYTRFLARTGTMENEGRRERFYTLFRVAGEVLSDQRRAGCVVECGVWRGLSACLLAEILKRSHAGRNLWLFDSFEGLSEFKEKDLEGSTIPPVDPEGRRRWFACDISTVMRIPELSTPNVHIVKGWVPGILNRLPAGPVALAHIDTDLYEPTKGALEVLWPRVPPGGAIICDDYDVPYFPGAKKAVDEYLEGRKDALLVPVPAGNAVIVKVQPG